MIEMSVKVAELRGTYKIQREKYFCASKNPQNLFPLLENVLQFGFQIVPDQDQLLGDAGA